MKKTILPIGILSLSLFIGCASKIATLTLEDVEKLRVDYSRGKIESVENLIAIYKDPLQPVEVRISAMQALAQTKHPDAQKILYDFLAQSVGLNYELLTATATALIENQTPDNVAAMVVGLTAAQRKYIEFRTTVMEKLQATDITLQVEQLLKIYQAEKENYIQMQESLTHLLGSTSDDKVIPILINIAKDKTVNNSIRALALEILGRKQNPLITATFIEMLGDPATQEQLRDFALQAIGDVKEAKVILALLETLNTGREQYYKLTEIITKALGDFSDPAVKPTLVEITKNTEFPLKTRKDALTALIKFNDPEVFKQLLPMMENPDNYILFDEMTSMAAALGDKTAFDKLRLKARVAQLSTTVQP